MMKGFWRGMERVAFGNSRRIVSILIFHRVRPVKDSILPNEPSSAEFDALMNFVSKNFRVAPLYECVMSLLGGKGARHTVAVTFDDGYADNIEVALPILQKHRVPATFFITSGMLDGGLMWNDQIIEAIRNTRHSELDLQKIGLGLFELNLPDEKLAAIRQLIRDLKYRDIHERSELASAIEEAAESSPSTDLMMTRAQARQLAEEPFADIGGHTVSHPILKRLNERDAFHEISAGKSSLEELLGRKLRCFAYPNGIPGRDYGREHVKMVRKAGFELAFSTSPGGVDASSDPLQLPRFIPWDKLHLMFGGRLLLTGRRNGEVANDRGHESRM